MLAAVVCRRCLAAVLSAGLELLLLHPAMAHPDHQNTAQPAAAANHDHSGRVVSWLYPVFVADVTASSTALDDSSAADKDA